MDVLRTHRRSMVRTSARDGGDVGCVQQVQRFRLTVETLSPSMGLELSAAQCPGFGTTLGLTDLVLDLGVSGVHYTSPLWPPVDVTLD